MEIKLIGILESKSDRFINDVVSHLNDVPVEFITLTAEKFPINRGYRVVVDRLSFRYPLLKEMVKSLALGGTYVINNPFAALSTNKIMEMQVGNSLGINFPRTVVLPDQVSVDETEGVVTQPRLDEIAGEIGLPCILKPFDGYAWEDVYLVNSIQELKDLYTSLRSQRILLAQQLIRFVNYFRVFCFNKRDVLFVKWIPKPSSMGQYLYDELDSLRDQKERLTDLTIKLNQSLDLDVNVVEWCVDEKGQWWVIDAFNEVPEVIPEALPPDYYSWLVDRFAACVRDKLNSGKANQVPFALPS